MGDGYGYRSLNAEASAVLLVKIFAVVLVLVAVVLPLASGEASPHQESYSTNITCKANESLPVTVAHDSSKKAPYADEGKCQATQASDQGGGGLGKLALRWSTYLGAATFALAAIGAVRCPRH